MSGLNLQSAPHSGHGRAALANLDLWVLALVSALAILPRDIDFQIVFHLAFRKYPVRNQGSQR